MSRGERVVNGLIGGEGCKHNSPHILGSFRRKLFAVFLLIGFWALWVSFGCWFDLLPGTPFDGLIGGQRAWLGDVRKESRRARTVVPLLTFSTSLRVAHCILGHWVEHCTKSCASLCLSLQLSSATKVWPDLLRQQPVNSLHLESNSK